MVKKVSMKKMKDKSMTQKFDLLQIIDELDVDNCKQASEAMMEKSKGVLNLRHGDDPESPEVSDFPSCDFCGVEYSGKLFCSKCKCVFYCSKECQKKHWKAVDGHKANCANMEELCESKAQSFMDAFETYKTCLGAFEYSENVVASACFNLITLLRNDGVNQNGPYKKALELGLNDALFFLFQDECMHVVNRFKQGIRVSIPETIHMYLFNTDRNNAAFNSIDGYRVKKYVRSKDDAFEKWFAASMKAFDIYQTQGFDAIKRKKLDLYFVLKRVACNVAHCWSLVFTNRKAAKAILLGETKEVDVKARERAKWIVSQLKHVHSNFQYDKHIISICSTDQSLGDSVSAVHGSVQHFTALIEGRMNEFQIDVGDFRHLIGLRGDKKFKYENMAVPWANAIIEKGTDIDLNETKEALLKQALSGNSNMEKMPNGANPSSKTKGKKKGKKKSKK